MSIFFNCHVIFHAGSLSIQSASYWWTLKLFPFFIIISAIFIHDTYCISLRSDHFCLQNISIFSFNRYCQIASKMLYQMLFIFPLAKYEIIHFLIVSPIPDISKLFFFLACLNLMGKNISLSFYFSFLCQAWTSFHIYQSVMFSIVTTLFFY